MGGEPNTHDIIQLFQIRRSTWGLSGVNAVSTGREGGCRRASLESGQLGVDGEGVGSSGMLTWPGVLVATMVVVPGLAHSWGWEVCSPEIDGGGVRLTTAW